MSLFKRHRAEWDSCERCELCSKRKHVVLARGQVPCDVLFVGEAPGASEDVLGKPFVGPAGQLLDRIVLQARGGSQVRIAFTNLISCIPLGEDGNKTAEPSLEAINACRPRLDQFVTLCKPKAVVLVGKLAAKHFPDQHLYLTTVITHPAAILRADIANRGLMIQNCIVAINDLIQEVEKV